MLVLTRRIGETVMIGRDIAVRILGVDANQVRIGIEAPKHVPVHRLEVFQQIEAANATDAGIPRMTSKSFIHLSERAR